MPSGMSADSILGALLYACYKAMCSSSPVRKLHVQLLMSDVVLYLERSRQLDAEDDAKLALSFNTCRLSFHIHFAFAPNTPPPCMVGHLADLLQTQVCKGDSYLSDECCAG